MFKVQTINCMQYNSEPAVRFTEFYNLNQTRSQSRNEINTQTEHFNSSKTQWFALIEKKLFGP